MRLSSLSRRPRKSRLPTDDHSQSRVHDRKSLGMWRQRNATLWTKGKVVSGSHWTFLNRGKRHHCIFQKDHSGSHWERAGPGLAQWVLLAECPNGSEGWWWRYRWGPAYLWVLCSHYNDEMSELKISETAFCLPLTLNIGEAGLRDDKWFP